MVQEVYNEDALALLKAADDVLLDKPEEGTATSKNRPEALLIFMFAGQSGRRAPMA